MFTTVGFGDISAGTEAEMIYVALVMVVGAVVHSIIISDVITIVTSTDRLHDFKETQFNAVDLFAEHTNLEDDVVQEMKAQIAYRAKYLMKNHEQKDEMYHLVTGKFFSRCFFGTLPEALFKGRIKANHFLTLTQELSLRKEVVPPALVCFLAIHLMHLEFEAGEVVFQKLDYPFHLYLVLKGSFTNVAMPSPTGGKDAAVGALSRAISGRELLTPSLTAGSKRRIIVTEKEGTGKLYPYRVYSFNNYFGDFELLPGKLRPRSSTVRCETVTGSCLGLPRDSFLAVVDRFPQSASSWAVLGQRREFCRIQQCRQLHYGLPIRPFSALRIQRHWRKARTWMRNHDRSADKPSASHTVELLVNMPPLNAMAGQATRNAEEDTGTCTWNSQCCYQQFDAFFNRDITELKDTMRLMVSELAAASRSLQSMESERALDEMCGTDLITRL